MRRAAFPVAAPDAIRRHLILAGGGHAHAHVLRMIGARPLAGVRVTLVSPEPLAVYSGMVPGVLVGAYGSDEGCIDVAALAARAGAAFLRDRVVAIDVAARAIRTERSGALPYDVLSLDVGSRPRGVASIRDFDHVVPVKPVEEATPRIAGYIAAAREGRAAPLAAVVGAGAGGIEVAFGLQARLASVPGARVTIVEAGSAPLPGAPERVRSRVLRLLAEHRIDLVTGADAARPSPHGVSFDDVGGRGGELEAGLVIWATGAEGLPLLRESGLAVDARGFLLVDAELRALGHPEILAAGDCALQADHPDTPRAGVFAVRQGPILSENLRATLAGRKLRRYVPQRRFLSLLSTGDRRALAIYGDRAAHGRVWWWLKDRIDRRFIARYAPPRPGSLRAPMTAEGGDAAAMAPCGGCAAKLGASALAEVLDQLDGAEARGVAIGLGARDDAAVLAAPAGDDLVFTVDGFPAFLDDPFALGEVGAVNAVSDVYAMGGKPLAALAMVTAPAGDGVAARAELLATMRGAQAGLARDATPLLGGHTLASGPLSIGFAVLGRIAPGAAMTKAAARAGDRLLLTKALGTGVVLAAARAGECPAAWTEAALASMRASNALAAEALAEAGVRACTDVSGFGLVGHLGEMLGASACGAEVIVPRIPGLPGARELLAAGWRSSAHDANARALREVAVAAEGAAAAVDLALACDPQTSGGLLAAVPAARLDALLAGLARRGIGAWVIGAILGEPGLRLRAETAGV
jgi:selenide,water dikinase